MKIVKDKNILQIPSEKFDCESELDLIMETEKKLWTTLIEHENGVGLAAPQIGIHKRICVICVKEQITLVNPKVIDTEVVILYREGCLSFPGVTIQTKRYESIIVDTDNLGRLYFTAEDNLLECVVVQHEINHLDGKLMFDFEWKRDPIRGNKKYGRNEKINIINPMTNAVIEQIKYKKAENYFKTGWVIVESN